MHEGLGRRGVYGSLAIATILVGLWIHRGAFSLGVDARDIAGDALWAMMMFWWVSALSPSSGLPRRTGIALAICFAVEFSQMIHARELDAIRATTLGHLVLGSGFDPRDLLSYTVGVAMAAALVRLARAAGDANRTSRRPL